MRPILGFFPIFITVATLARSQNEVSAVAQYPVSVPRILGKIPDGTPPPAAAPKPQFVIAPQDILDSKTHQQGGRTITIQQINPIALPPPPAPVEAAVAENEQFTQRAAEYRAAHPKADLLCIGATIYRSKDSPPRTLVRYWPEGRREEIRFWSSADFALIAGGIQSFEDSESHTHSIFMSWSTVDMDRMADLQVTNGCHDEAPEMPTLPEGKATFEIVGDPPSAGDLLPIQALHDIYNDEFGRLKAAHDGRERARLAHEAELKAHPPKPKDITLNYWCTETPASKEKEVAR
jgi:hypothetical protein